MDNIAVVNAILLFGAALMLVGILSSLVASRFGAPLLLVFLLIGMLTGQDGPGGVAFDNYSVTYLIGSIALAIILFDGGLRTRISHLAGALWPAVTLATAGVLATAGMIGVFASWVLGLNWLEGLLIGATIASTDAAAVFFLIRASGLQLQRRVGVTLEVESSTNDPVAVFLTVLLVGVVTATGGDSAGAIVGHFLQEALIGGAAGVAGGFALAFVLNRVDLPSGLHPLFVVAFVVALYGLSGVLHGSGFLAVYLAGIIVGNRQVRALPSIIAFHDTVTWLCQIVMFIVLGLLVTPSEMAPTILPALAISFVLIFVARPIAVALCLLPFGFSRREIGFVGWVGLRGAVSIFLAAIPTLAQVPNAQIYFNVAFVVVIVSLVVQGWTITPLAKRLQLAVRKTARSVQRVEIDLPGQLSQEMIGYLVTPHCPILNRDSMPKWAKPVFVMRDDRILDPQQAGSLKPGDYGYFLAAPERVAELDGLFASTEAGRARPALGEFPLRGEAALAQLVELYGLQVDPLEVDRSVAEIFDLRFEHEPTVGDTLEFGPATLIVRGVDEGKVVRAGLRLEDEGEAADTASTSLVQDSAPSRPPTKGAIGSLIDAVRFCDRPQRKPFGNHGGPKLRAMIVRTKWRMVAAQISLWIVAAAAVAYFGQQAYVGDHGLVASRSMEAEIAKLETRLASIKAERAGIEHRIDLLSTDRLDPDLLDQQARTDLGWLSPSDRVLRRDQVLHRD